MKRTSTLLKLFKKSFLVLLGFLCITIINSKSYAQTKQRVYASRQINNTYGICVGCGTVNGLNAVDGNPYTASTISAVLGLLSGGAYQDLIFDGQLPASNTGSVVKISTGSALSAGLLGAISVQAYNGSNPVGAVINGNSALLNLLASGNQSELFVPAPGVPYDRVRVTLDAGLLSVLTSIDVYHAYFLKDVTNVNCDAPIDELHGISGDVGAIGGVMNPENALDGQDGTFSTLTSAIGLLGYTQQTIIFPGLSTLGDSVRVVVSTGPTLLSLQLLNAISIETFNGNQSNGVASGNGGLIKLGLLSPGSSLGVLTFAPGAKFDRVQFRMGGVANVLSSVNLHEISRMLPLPVITEINNTASNSGIACAGDGVVLKINNPEAGVTYTWYTQATGGTGTVGVTFTPSGLVTGVNNFYVTGKRAGCTNESPRKLVKVTVNNPVAPVLSAYPAICSGSKVTLKIDAPVAGLTYKWYEDATGGTAVFTGDTFLTPDLTANKTYYVESVIGNCTSARIKVDVTVNPVPPSADVATKSIAITSGQRATLVAIAPAAGGTINWYTAATGGTPIATGLTFITDPLTASKSYFAEIQTAAGCVSAVRTEVIVTVIGAPVNVNCNKPNAQQSGISGGLLCALCSVTNPGASIDNDPLTFTRINLTLGIGASGYQRLFFPAAGAETDSIRLDLRLPGGLLDLSVLGGITANLWNGNAVVKTYQLNSSLIKLSLLGGDRFKVTIPTNAVYDGIEIRFQATVAALTALDIFGAELIYPNPTVAASGQAICYGTNTTLTATPNGGTNLKWYSAESGGDLLATGNSFTTTTPLTGTTTFYIEVSKGVCANAQRVPVKVTVNPQVVLPVTVLSNATIAASYSKQITPATGGTPAFTYALAAGSTLPAGLSLSEDGTIAGTPTLAGDYNFSITAKDSKECSATTAYSLKVTAALSLPTKTFPNGTVATVYVTQTIPEVTGGTAPYTYTAGNLPPGLSFDPATREIKGTPTQKGTFIIPVTVTDVNGNTISVDYTIVVRDALALANVPLANGTVNAVYPTQTIPAATGGSGSYVYSVVAADLPPGLTFDETTRQITGTPTQLGTFTFPVKVTDNEGRTVTTNYTIIVRNPLVLAAKTLADGTVGTLYVTETIPAATGGTGSYVYAATGLPPGLTFNPGTRQISGTPTQSGSYNVSVKVTDSDGTIANQIYTIKVNGELNLPSATLPNGLVGTVYPTQTLPAVTGGTAPYIYAATGLPPGLTFTPATRQISGTPLTGGTFTVTQSVTDNNGISTSTDYIIVVNVGAPVVNAATVCGGTSATLSVSNVQAGVTYNWYAATGSTPVFTGTTYTTNPLSASTTFYVEAVSGTAVSSRTPVNVTINAIPDPAIVITANESVSPGQSAKLLVSAANGSTIKWYAAPTGGTSFFTGASYTTPPLTNTTTYYVETENANGCVSASRVAVTVKVINIPGNTRCNAAVSQQSGIDGICLLCNVQDPGNSVDADPDNFTRINLTVGLGGTGYQKLIFAAPGAATDSIRLDLATPVGLADLNILGNITVTVMNGNTVVGTPYPLNASLIDLKLLNGNRFKATLAAGGVYDRVEVRFGAVVAALSNLNIYGAEIIYPNPTIAATGRKICAGSTTTLTATANGGTTLKWYSTPTGGTSLASGATFTTPSLSANTTYYIEVSKGTCANVQRVPVTVEVTAIPDVPVVVNAGPVCAGSSAILSINNPVATTTYRWYTSSTGGTPIFEGAVFTSPALNAGTTYFVEAANGTCVSASRTAVDVVVNPRPVLPQVKASVTTVSPGQTAILNASSTETNVTFKWYTSANATTPIYTGPTYVTAPLTVATTYYLEAVSNATGCATSSRVQITINVDNNGVVSPVPCEAAISESNGVDGIALLAGVYNPALAIDNDAKTASSLVVPVGLLGGSVYQRLGFTGLSNIGDTVRVKLTSPGKLLSLGLLSGITLTTYNNNTSNNDGLSLGNPLIRLELLSGNTEALVSFVPTAVFDKVEVRLNAGIVGVLTTVDLNYGQRVIAAPKVVSADVTGCETQKVTLGVQNPIPGIVYKWYDASGVYLTGKDGATFETPALTVNTKYYVSANNASGCLSYKTQVNVTVNPKPDQPILSLNDIKICSGESVVLTVSNPQPGLTYIWKDGSGTIVQSGPATTYKTPAITALVNYTVLAKNACGAESTAATAKVEPGATPSLPVITPPAVTINKNERAILTATSSAAGAKFTWYDGDPALSGSSIVSSPTNGENGTFLTPVLSATTTYWVTSTAGTCVSAGASVVVTVLADPNPGDVPCEAAINEENGIGGVLSVLAGVDNPSLVFDNNINTGSSLRIPIGIGSFVYQRAIFNGLSTIGDKVSLKLVTPNALLSLALLSSVEVTTYNGSTSNNDTKVISNPSILLTLLPGNKEAIVEFTPTSKFDRVELRLNSGLLGALTSINFNYAQRILVPPVVQATTASACTGTQATLSVKDPVLDGTITYKWLMGTDPTVVGTGPIYKTAVTLADGTYDFYVVASRNNCESTKTKVTVTILPQPGVPVEVDGNPKSTCINTPVTLAVKQVAGVSYTWYDAATNGNVLAANTSTYTTPANLGAGTYEYFVEAVNGNSCINAARTKITLVVKPNAAASDITAADQTICAGNTAILKASSTITGATFKWYKNPDLTDTPFEGPDFTTPVLTATTKYYVIVSGPGICSNDAASAKVVTVTVNRSATPSDIIAADKIICSGSTVVLNASSTTITNPVFRWYKNADLTDTPFEGPDFTTDILTTTTKYYVTVSGLNTCANDAASAKVVTVTVNRSATDADIIAADATTCSGTSVVLTATSTTITNPVFSWYRDPALTDLAVRGNSFTTPQLTTTTKYYVTVSSADVCTNDAATAKIVTVTINRNATDADIIVADQTICSGTTAILSASSTTVTAPVFKWYRDASLTDLAFTGPTFTTPALTLTTKYYVTVSGNGACANDMLSAKVVTVTVTRNAGLTDIITNDQTICSGMTASLSASSTIPGAKFIWYRDAALTDVAFITPNVTTPVLTVTTRYYVTVSGTGVCANLPGMAKEVVVTVNPLPNVPIISPAGTAICSGEATVLTIQNPQNGITYEWYDAPSNGTLVNTGTSFTTGILNGTVDYYVQATSIAGCGSATGRVKVTVTVTTKPQPPSVVLGTVNTCLGSTATLTVANPVAGVTYNWYATSTSTEVLGSGPNFTTPPVTASTITYYVEAKSGNCTSTSRTPVVVNTQALPAAPLSVSGAENPLCPGTTTVLSVNNPDATLKYAWYNVQSGGTPLAEGNTFNVPALNVTTIYYVGSINVVTGCASSSRTAVTVNVLSKLEAPVVTVQSVTATSVTFAWTPVAGATGYEVSTDAGLTWTQPSSGAAGTSHLIAGLLPNQKVTIRVRAKGKQDCQLSDATSLTGSSDNPLGNDIFVPNTFTPNNDGKNDILYVYGNTIAKMRLRVYNQWGQFLYESLNIQNGWDGTYKGQMQPNGVYVYYLEAEFNDGTKAIKKGTITLLR